MTSASNPETPLDPAEFINALTSMLGAERFSGLDPSESTGLWDELGMDSLDAIRLIVWTEDLSGVGFPAVDLPPMFTLGDVYAYYRRLRSSQANDL